VQQPNVSKQREDSGLKILSSTVVFGGVGWRDRTKRGWNVNDCVPDPPAAPIGDEISDGTPRGMPYFRRPPKQAVEDEFLPLRCGAGQMALRMGSQRKWPVGPDSMAVDDAR